MKTINLKDVLQTTGLSQKEVIVLRLLFEEGQVPVREIVKKTALNRGTVYSILKTLVEKKLAYMLDVKKILHASPNHPENILNYIRQRKTEIMLAEANYKNAYPEMLSIFNLKHTLPSIQFLEGISGLKWVYNDLLAEKKDLLLIRSIYDNDQPDLKDAVELQIKRQIRRKIKTRALTPIVKDSKFYYENLDKKNLVERRLIDKDIFSLEAQVMIYSDRVAITSMKGPILTTWLKNKSINQSLTVLFEYIWQMSLPAHKEILTKWQ